jgi:CBS domain containing-hemolysin-like protein
MTIDITSLYVVLLIALAAVCSGLNISLISLNPTDLKRKAKLGDKRAKRVLPFRMNAHLSLASILLVNAGAASTMPLVLHTHLNGVYAVIISTFLLVIFGELAPQALFTKHALQLCSYFSPLLRIMVIITYPISKPLQLGFDRMVGRQEGDALHSRRELGLLISDHLNEPQSDLDDDEVEIIQGALQLSEKHVSEIMTPIERVYWIKNHDIIDSKKIDEIKLANWSRIPVFNKNLTKCYGILRMKDLVDIDFDERNYEIADLTLHPVKTVGSRTALDTMFRHFIGARTHLMPVEKNDEIVGIITIEDLIEEIIGHEIIDESDHMAHRG